MTGVRMMVAAAALVVVAAAGVAYLGLAATAANTLPATSLSALSYNPSVNDLKPNACNALAQTARLTGNGNITGVAAAEVILGGPAVQTLRGQGGNDCVVGGSGNDTLNGGAGTDVCIGGPGVDSFNANCETQIQ